VSPYSSPADAYASPSLPLLSPTAAILSLYCPLHQAEVEVMLLENELTVFRSGSDVKIFVSGPMHENGT